MGRLPSARPPRRPDGLATPTPAMRDLVRDAWPTRTTHRSEPPTTAPSRGRAGAGIRARSGGHPPRTLPSGADLDHPVAGVADHSRSELSQSDCGIQGQLVKASAPRLVQLLAVAHGIR